MKVFLKAQLSSFIGAMFDYAMMIVLTELVGVYYVISTAVGAAFGALINFTVNRHWTFKAIQKSAYKQLPKFVLVVIGSILLKTYGTYFITEVFRFDYKISRITIDVLVGIFFNFFLQKKWVFKLD